MSYNFSLNNLDKLPREIIEEYIWPNISLRIKVLLNKFYYEKYHYIIYQFIPDNQRDSYIRFVIRNDYSMILNKLLQQNFKDWIKLLHYQYKNELFYNYIFFLSHFAVENTSSKSNYLINDYLKIAGYEKKWHKKNSSKHIRWSN
jgi:hypothetical protein